MFATRIWLLCALLAAMLITAVFGFIGNIAPVDTVEKEDNNVAYAGAVQDAWATAVRDNGTYQLTANWTATANSSTGFGTSSITTAFKSGALFVPAGKTVTLDLNGYTLNRNNTSARSYGAAIIVYGGGKLTIKSSRANGTITGGFSSSGAGYGAGGICVSGSGSSVTIDNSLYSVNISNCKTSTASTGSAISVYNGASLTISGSKGTTISSCQNTYTSGSYSGAICIAGNSKADVSNLTISSCSTLYQYCGSAVNIYNNSAAVSFTNCTLTGNSVANRYSGGSVFIGQSSNVKFTDCTIKSSSASGSYSGGGVMMWYSTATFTNCTIQSNSAASSYSAGGICVNGDGGNSHSSTLYLTGGTVSGNKNTYTSNYGAGGVFVYNTSTLHNSATITGNTSAGTYHSGGIFIGYGTGASKVYMTGGEVTNNTATAANATGGVTIPKGTGHIFQLTGGTISGNKGGSSTYASGGVFILTGNTFNVGGNPKIQSNTLSSGVTANVIFSATTQYMNCISAFTSGAKIGVTKLGNNYDLSLSRITANYNTYNGSVNPATYFFADDSAHYTIKRWDPTSANPTGEAMVFCYKNDKNWSDACAASTSGQKKVTLYSNWTGANLSTLSAGFSSGAAYCASGQNVLLDLNGYTVSRSNSSAVSGGYVFYNKGTLEIIDSKGGGKISGGNNSSSYGGAIYSYGTALTLRNITISGNKAVNGGAITHRSNNLNIYNCTITGNSATTNGGGIHIYAGTVNLYSGTISGNTAANGGGVYLNNGYFYMRGNSGAATITNNTATTLAGGVYIADSKPFYMGGTATVYGNKQGTKASNVYFVNATQLINIISKMTATTMTGVTRSTIGLLTTGWVSKNPGVSPETMFVSDTTDKYVMEYASGEAAFLSMNNDENWLSAVKNSIAEKNRHKVKLTKNWTGTLGTDSTAYWNGGLYVPSGANILLDLNGYTINRGLTSATSGGLVIRVEGGTLEIIDSSTAQTGTIRGGYNSYSTTSGVYRRAGGICVYNGTLTMRGGTITGNRVTTGSSGAGVQLVGSTFTMYGGTISGNTAEYAGATAGGVYVYSGTFNMYGGTISGNTCPFHLTAAAGGVCVYTGAAINMRGDVKIQNNKFTDNTGSDVSTVDQAATINITGALASTARVGFRREVNNYTLTSGSAFTKNFSTYNSGVDPATRFFASENLRHRVNSGGTEARLWCIDNATNWKNCYVAGSGTVTLYSNWTATGGNLGTSTGFSGGRLYCYGKTMTLDLNGYTINRGLTTATASGQVIYHRSGTLTIIDSSTAKTGKITGGYSNEAYGGGIYSAAGTLNLRGGEITGNRSSGTAAGGVYLASGVICNLGNSISVHDNFAGSKKSNVYCVNISQMFGVVSPLTSTKKIGIYRDKNGVFTTNFATHMSGKNASDSFTCDMDIFFVYNSASGEGSLLTTDNSANWEDAVLASAANAAAWQSVILCKDWVPASGNSYGTNSSAFYQGAMYVPSSASIILDLNGYTINRKLTSAISHGYLFRVRGKLRIIDSSATKAGKITGGYTDYGTSLSEYSAGAIAVNSGGVLTIEAGQITGNRTAGTYGVGGISCNGTLNITGGTITGNNGTYVGGVYMTGQRLTVSGLTKITGNTVGSAASNVFFATQTHLILVGGALTSGSQIGITRTGNIDNYSSDNVITSGFKRYNTVKANTIFTSDSANFIIDETSAEAKVFCVNNAMNWTNALVKGGNQTVKLYSDWNAGYDASYTTTFYQTVAPDTDYFRNGALYVPSGKAVTLDLNGFNLNRKLTKAVSNGYVIYVEGTLEIKNSSGIETKKVTGGWNSDGAGGVMLAGSGILRMSSGTISGNIGKMGAGVYVDTSAKIYLGNVARIESNVNLSNVSSNIYLVGATQVVNITSKIEPGRVYGLWRAANGDATKDWPTYNKRQLPEDFFVSEHPNYSVMTGGTGELAFLSEFIDINWQSAVQFSLETKTSQSVKLTSDWIATNGNFGSGTGYYGGMLYVPAGASIVLDMNGFNINRNLSSAINYGGIFRINGELTIINRKGTGSIITGGKNTYQSNARAGGAYVATGGNLSVTGAIFKGNSESTESGAGGVYVANGGSFTIKDGGVQGNTGVNYGGVYLDNGARLQVGGAAVIKDNVLTSGAKRDVQFVNIKDKIYVNAKLTAGADVRVYKPINNYLHDGHDIITSGYSRFNSEAAETYFHASDDPAHQVVRSAAGSECALFCYDNKSNWVNAIVASASKQETFTLYSDWTATNGSFGSGTGFYSTGALRVPSSRNIIIDLNGFTINRNLSTATTNGYVMYLQSRVQIIDSSAAKTGKITGGYTNTPTAASGLYVYAGTTTITGGAITGNRGGYGVHVYSSAFLELGGTAQITGNYEGSTAKDINLTNTTATVNIVSKFDDSAKFGISRAANGTFTKNYGKYNADASPATYFTSQNKDYYVTDNGLEGSSLEGFFLSTDPKINWQYAVTQSINNNGKTQTFRLMSNWNAVNGSFGSGTGFRSSSGLYVPSNASIILDLNGFTINKGNSTTNASRSLLFVDGKLEIIDSSDTQTGKITGGLVTASSTYERSACMLIRYGKVVMRGGSITGNRVTNGNITSAGGVYVYSGATFEMRGGSITGNSGYKTGGVFVVKGGIFNLGGSAQIYGNHSLNSSGASVGYDSDVYFQNTDGGYANIVAPFEYNADGTAKAKIGVLADVKKIISSGTPITSGWYRYNPDKEAESVFFSDEPTEYGVEGAISGSGQEAVLFCLNNSINWGNAVTKSLNEKNTQTFKLHSNWIPTMTGSYPKMFGSGTGYRYGALRVPTGASIILDLNGFNIDRQMTSSHVNGYVICVEGSLTIIDSTVADSGEIVQGKIMGGWSSGTGYRSAGGIFVASNGKLEMFGGAVTGNKSEKYGGVSLYTTNVTFNMGGTATVYGNHDLNGNSSDFYFWLKDQMINITKPMRFASGDAGHMSVMRGTIASNGKPNGLGQLTNGWGKNAPGEDPADHFYPSSAYAEYIVVSSLDFNGSSEAIILSNDNLDNWVFAVTTSLNNNMTTRFTLSSNWTASSYTKYSYYKTSFGQVSNCFQNGGLLVPAGASIVMDLNGKSLNRNHPTNLDTQYAAFNFVILVKGSLQIVDSSTGKTGTITGGSYGVQIAENGFVSIGALPEDSDYMKGNGSQYVVRDEARGSGSITGNTVYGVYSTAGALSMTGGRITGNPVGAYMGVNSSNKDSKIMLGGNAYIYSDGTATKDLVLASLFSEINIISEFKDGAKVGFTRDAIGQLTSGWGEHNGDDSDPLPYFISKNSDKYNMEVDTADDGHKEVFITSYDNLLNWQYAVSKSLLTGKQETFIMYGCWTADADATYTTAFGKTSAFINGALYVPSGANILMNMNGHKLDRALTGTGASSGYVIYVDGTLEIIDDKQPNPVTLPDCYRDGGMITGGYNKSGSSGGAIHIGRGTLTLNDVTVTGNKADSTSASSGAIYVGGTFNFVSGTISHNEGWSAGGVYVATTGTFNMPESEKAAVITENNASGAGGGAVYTSGVFNMADGVISKNTSTIGGVYVANGGKFTLSGDGTVTENRGSGAGGVYVYNSTSTYFNMDGGYVTKNEGITSGGVYATGTVNMTGGEISGNIATGAAGSATDDGGSGMYITGSANVTITGGRITGNRGLNGIRVYSSGTLNLGGSPEISGNITTDAELIAAEGGGEVYCDIFLTAETRKLFITSKFEAGAHIGVYRKGAGVITKNYGKFNEEHPNNYFFSNKSIYAIAVTTPEEDTYAEAVVGTPIDAPQEYLVDGKSPVYNGQWQTIITGYDDQKMLSENLPTGVRGEIRDADGNVIIEAVDAGTYIITFTLAPSYCWKDGSTAPKQIPVKIMPYTVSIEWTDEKHTNADGEEEGCRYDGVTVHVPKASVNPDSLFDNVLTGKKDECTVDVDGATIYASGADGHTATATYLSNPNYQIDADSATHVFYVAKADLPDFKITTTQAEYKTPCTIKVSGNLENGKLTFSLPDNPDNVTLDASTGEFISSEKDLTKRIKVKVTVEATANYLESEAYAEIEVLPGKVHTEINEKEVIYGETVQLTLKDYDETEMGAVTYTFNNVTGIGNVTESGVFTTKKVGEVEVTATIAARDPYAETVITGTVTIVPRVMTVSWDELSAIYDGNAHSPKVSAASGVIDADKDSLTLSVEPASFVNAGRYDISVVISSSNYKLATEEEYHNVYEIFKANLTLSFKDKTAYYDTPFTPQIDGNLGGGAVTFVVDDTILRANGGNSFTPLDVGKTNITANVAESENYNAGTVTAEFTILPAPMKLTLTSTTTVYGDDLTLATSGNDGSEVSFALAAESEEYASITDGVLKPKKVGTVKVVMSAAATDHYQAAIGVEATVTITQREVEIIWDNLEFVYDKTGKLPTAAVNALGLVNGDTCTVTTVTVKGYSEAVNAGNYMAVASGLSNPNYKPNTDTLEKQFVIKPKQATIAWEEGVTYTYKGTAQAPKASVTNLEDGDVCNVIVLGTKNAATGITAMATGLDNPNYTLDEVINITTVYDILPFPITVSWGNLALVYNGKEQAPTATAVGLFAGDSCEIIITGAQTNVGEYTATAIGVRNSNYKLKDDTDHSTLFTISRGDLSDIAFEEGDAIYGDPFTIKLLNVPAYSAITYTLGAGAENVILSGDRIIPINIGSVTVTATIAATENFGEASVTKTIAILPRPVEISWDDLSFEYDKTSHIPTATITNLVNSDSCIITVEGAQTDAGTHTASVTAITNGKYTLAGGKNLSQEFTIAPRYITVEWGATELTYNGTVQHPDITVGNLLDGDECSTIVEGAKDAGINLIATLTGITNPNYTMEPVDNKTVVFNINRLAVQLEWSALSLIYNGEEQGPSARVTNLCAGDVCDVTVAGREVEVGTYTASAIALSNPNYELPGEVEVSFTIGKAPRTFSLTSTSTVYGTDLSIGVIGVDENDVVTYSVTNGTGSATLSEDVLTPTKAGKVTLTVKVAATANYQEAIIDFEITIEKYAVAIEWEYPEFIYDGTEHKPTATVSNVLDGETCDVLSVTGAVHAGNAQTATVTAISNPNYTLEGGRDVSTTFTISPMPVTIAWDENRTYVYDGTPKGPEAHATDLIAGDTCNITISGKETNAGSYNATIISLDNTDYTLDGAIGLTTDYVIERAHPTITIKTTSAILGIPRNIEIEGNFGGGVVSFEIDEGKDLGYISGTRLISQKAGTVKVHAYVGETINTYAAEAVGEIVIAKGDAPLVIDRSTVTYGNTLPLAVDDNDGFLRDDNGNLVFGDVTFTVVENDRAVIESGNILRPLKAGILHVIMSTQETENFIATSVTVEITVNKRVVTLDWSDGKFIYNKTEQKPTATITNLVGNDVCTVNVTGAVNAGTGWTARAVSLSDEENYTLEGAVNTEKTFDIAPLALDIHWGELSMQFNGNHQYPNAWVDTIDNETCTVTLEGGGRNVGKYEVRATGLSNSNYVLAEDNLTVEMEITPAYINPVLSPTTAVYHEEVTLSISGNLENGAVTYTVVADESEGAAEITGDKFYPTKAGNVVVLINVAETANCYAYEGKATIFVDKALRGEIELVNNKTVYGETLTLDITGNETEPGTVTYSVSNTAGGDGTENPEDLRAVIDSDGVTLITKHAGKAYVTITISETENYKEMVVVKEVDIAPRVAEITWTNTEFDYNGQVQTPTAAVANLINGDECTVYVSGGEENAGSYFASVASLSNPDYTYVGSLTAHTPFTIGKVEISLELTNDYITINKNEKLVIKVTGLKGNDTYDAPVTYEVSNGTGTAIITDADGNAAADGQYIKGTRLGTVIVTASVPATTNYLAAEIKSLVIIEKDKPTITLKTATVMYGDTLTLEIEGNVDNGRVTYTVSNATGSATFSDGVLRPLRVGVVNVTVTVAETENYGMSSTTHEVTITPRPITGLEWDDNTLDFTYDGISIFAPEAKALGLINGDECGVVVSGGQMKAGTYNTAYASSLTNPNYSLEGVDVNAPEFIINKRKPKIEILTTSITIGVPTIIEISGNNDNAKVGYMLENGSGMATLEGGVITGTKLGEVYLTVSVPETDNYLFGSASAVILVEKPATPFEVEDTQTVYGTDLALSVVNNIENGAVTYSLKDGTTLATLNGNVLTPTGAGEVIVVVTVAATSSYKETTKEIKVTILPKPVEIAWEYPEFVYDQEEHKPIATVANLEDGDECLVEVLGYINAGTDCPASAIGLSNPSYTLDGCTGLETTFVIKPRPVELLWSVPEFTYNGEVQTPKAAVMNELDGDTVKITNISGSKDAGENLVATALETDNPNYTVEGGINISTTYSIKPFVVEIEWGNLRIPYNGKVNVPEVRAVGTFNDEVALAEVQGDGIHVRDEPYIATVKGMVGPNYVISQATLDDPELITAEYYIVPAEVTFDEETLVKEYNGEAQQPEFKIHLLAESDDLYIEVSGGGTAVGNYNVDLTLKGTSVGDYVLAEADKTKLFEIVKKSLTLKIKANDRDEKYTGEALDVSLWTDWFTASIDGLLAADAGKSLEELFSSVTLQFVPEIYESLGGTALSEVIEKGNYFILPALLSGNATGADNYNLKEIVYESGILTLGAKRYLQLTEESTYQFIYEQEAEFGFKYIRAYGEGGIAHGVDDLDFTFYAVGQIPLNTSVAEFLLNIVDLSLLKIYTQNDILIFENGQPVEGFESIMTDSSYYVGTGWRAEYGEGEEIDVVWISVLGDLDGDGSIGVSDMAAVTSYIEGARILDRIHRLAAMLTNKGSISASDVSAMSVVYNNGKDAIKDYFTYKKPVL